MQDFTHKWERTSVPQPAICTCIIKSLIRCLFVLGIGGDQSSSERDGGGGREAEGDAEGGRHTDEHDVPRTGCRLWILLSDQKSDVLMRQNVWKLFITFVSPNNFYKLHFWDSLYKLHPWLMLYAWTKTLTLAITFLPDVYCLWQGLSHGTIIFDLMTLKFDLLLKNFNLGHNFLNRSDRAFLLHMCFYIQCTVIFDLMTLTLKFDLLLKNF